MTSEPKDNGLKISRRWAILVGIAGLLLATNIGILVVRSLRERLPEAVAHAYVPPKFPALPEPSPQEMESFVTSVAGPFSLGQSFPATTSPDLWINISNVGIAYSSIDKKNHLVGWFRRTGEEQMDEWTRQVHVVITMAGTDGKTHILQDQVFLNPRPTVDPTGYTEGSDSIDATFPVKLTEIKHLTLRFTEEKRRL
jgi:hypothetical protein